MTLDFCKSLTITLFVRKPDSGELELLPFMYLVRNKLLKFNLVLEKLVLGWKCIFWGSSFALLGWVAFYRFGTPMLVYFLRE